MQQQQQQQSVNLHPAKRLRVQAEPTSAAPQPPLSQHRALPAEPPLQNFLGDYGSEGESDEDAQQPAGSVQPVAPKTKLPSAEELLESEFASTVGGGVGSGGTHPSDAMEAAVLVLCWQKRAATTRTGFLGVIFSGCLVMHLAVRRTTCTARGSGGSLQYCDERVTEPPAPWTPPPIAQPLHTLAVLFMSCY